MDINESEFKLAQNDINETAIYINIFLNLYII